MSDNPRLRTVIEAIEDRRTTLTAEQLVRGHTVLERTDRGTIKTRAAVTQTVNCPTDPGCIHAHVVVMGKLHTWCYFRSASVEVE